VRLTATGIQAQERYRHLLRDLEKRWQKQFGEPAITALRNSLESIVIDQKARLQAGIEPHPDGWRAKVPRPETLPHFPMVSHRGGFPDGS
jgi:hypothetical protein